MPDYRKMYHIMSGAVTDAERLLAKALIILSKARIECEEIYFESEDGPVNNNSPSREEAAGE